MADTTDTQAALIGVVAELTAMLDHLTAGEIPYLIDGTPADDLTLAARIEAAVACLEGRSVLHDVTVYFHPAVDPNDMVAVASSFTRVVPPPGAAVIGCAVGPDPLLASYYDDGVGRAGEQVQALDAAIDQMALEQMFQQPHRPPGLLPFPWPIQWPPPDTPSSPGI